MKIAVCIRRVPDTTAKIAIAASGAAIETSGVKFVLNPYDEHAVEAALALQEATGAGETVVVGFGDDSVPETLRAAMSFGIDRAIHLQGTPSADALANARVLAAHLADGGYDLVLFGKLAADDYGQQTGPMVAELLEWPCATAVCALAVNGTSVSIEREVEGGIETSTCTLPAVITCDKGLNKPRSATLKGIMAAKKKPLEVVTAAVGDAASTVVGLALPPERSAGRIVGEGAAAVPALIEALTTQAKVL